MSVQVRESSVSRRREGRGAMQAVRLAGCLALSSPNSLSTMQPPNAGRQERGIVHSTTRATTHGNSRAPPPDLTGLCCWPHTPQAGFPLSTTSASQPYTYFNSSQLVEMFLARMMPKKLLKLIGICKKLMILQFCRQPSFIGMLIFLSKQKSQMFLSPYMTIDSMRLFYRQASSTHILILMYIEKLNILPQEWLWLWLLWGYFAGRHPLTGQPLTFWEDDTHTLDLHHNNHRPTSQPP